jgi:hypothetical protein
MPFIPPMLATRLEDPRRLAEPRYSAELGLMGSGPMRRSHHGLSPVFASSPSGMPSHRHPSMPSAIQ